MESITIKNFRKYLCNTPMGVFIGVLFGIFWMWAMDGQFGEDSSKLYTYVISAIVSLLVAAIALAGVFANIQGAHDREEEARRRKMMAAKAMLPHVLSEMCDVFERGMNYSSKDVCDFSLDDLRFPETVLQTVHDIIELHETSQIVVANRLVDILMLHQVFYSRWQTNVESDPSRMTEVDLLYRTISWAYLRAATCSLFNYARNRANIEEISFERVKASLALVLDEEFYQREEVYLGFATEILSSLNEQVR
jgi:hypothetical protein